MEDDEAQNLDDLAYYVGVPVAQWGEKELREALRMSMRATAAMQRLAVENMVRAQDAEDELARRKRSGRPRKAANTIARLLKPKKPGGRPRKFSDAENKALLAFVEEHKARAPDNGPRWRQVDALIAFHNTLKPGRRPKKAELKSLEYRLSRLKIQ